MNTATHEKSMRDRTESMISLNKVEIALGLVVAAVSLTSAVGCWFVLPYRMQLAEDSIQELRTEIKQVRDDNNRNQELLVRMDERIKTIQQALKIPVSQ